MKIWEQIVEKNCHMVVEASAGTGKTYTIEHLVAELLKKKKDLRLDQILIVTYTDKAAGEMKNRIRAHLEEEMVAWPVLKDSVDHFDSAQISTIHGFCQKILQEYAFENRQTFDLDLVDDESLVDSALYDLMRRNWKEWYGDSLKQVLESSGIMQERILSCIKRVALSLRNAEYDTVKPAPVLEEISVLESIMTHLKTLSESFFDAFTDYPAKSAPRKRIAESISLIINSYRLCVGGGSEQGELLHVLRDEFKKISKESCYKGDAGFSCLYGTPRKQLPELVDAFKHAIPLLEQLINDLFVYDYEIIVKTIFELKKSIELLKAEDGLVSFDDLLRLVQRALCRDEEGAQVLVNTLRNKYQYALVDEFQDTDPIQWDIFRKLFVEGGGGQRLILVGDPKQAIYAFRGADIFTYQKAVNEIGNVEALTFNYRSSEELIQVFNTIFNSGTWFIPEGYPAEKGKVVYQSITFPGTVPDVVRDLTKRAALNLIHVDATAVGKAAFPYSVAIVNEIEQLLENAGLFLIKEEVEGQEQIRQLNAGDICILVQKKKSAASIEKMLRQKQIPFSFYKKTGLYQSDEAAALCYLLAALNDLNNEQAITKALLTEFFNFSLADFSVASRLADQAIRNLLDKWFKIAETAAWPKLFRTIIDDTGLFFHVSENILDERKITNYKHLFQDLATVAYEQNLDLNGLYEILEQRKRDAVEVSDEGTLHRIESEEPKVQIMTMHTSKGLQFPLVFIADGFGDADYMIRQGAKHITYHDDNDKRCFELVTPLTNRKRSLNENHEELKRLYYVAMTRAKYKLFLPYVTVEKNSKWTVATNLIAPACQPFLPSHKQAGEEYHKIVCNLNKDGECLDAICSGSLDSVSPQDLLEIAAGHDKKLLELPLEDTPNLYYNQMRVDSYSSLAKGHHSVNRSAIVHDSKAAVAKDDEPFAPARLVDEQENLIEGGKNTGNLFHDLMEYLFSVENTPCDITLVHQYRNSGAETMLQHDSIADLLEQQMKRYRVIDKKGFSGTFPATTQESLAQMLWNTLNQPLPDADHQLFSLSSLPLADCKAELEFYLKENADNFNLATDNDDLIKGFIDLLFRRNGKFYILDWKTNTSDNGDYSQDALQRMMAESDYHLQYKIYSVAIIKWLQHYYHGFDHTSQFGGVYYLFVRGIQNSESLDGVFFEAWDGNLEAVKNDIKARMIETGRITEKTVTLGDE